MRLIFIRHAEPDYEHKCLTEKGYREAEILSRRTKDWTNIRKVYVSPLPRARMTAEPTLREWGRDAEVIPFLQEFDYKITHPSTGTMHVPWDLFPEYFSQYPELYDRDRWLTAPLYRSNPAIEPAYRELTAGIDAILAENGYFRAKRVCEQSADISAAKPFSEAADTFSATGTMYLLDRAKTDGDEEDALVFFCHFGVTAVILGHLIGVSPFVLLHHTVILPTGVTVVTFEKRVPDKAHLRIQVMGDVRHLHEAGEPLSAYAAFSPVFQG